MAKFRKRPVIIDAEQWFPDVKIEGVESPPLPSTSQGEEYLRVYGPCGLIQTLEGEMTVMPGDWVITGIKGEKYPCKPDIFEATYERVEEISPVVQELTLVQWADFIVSIGRELYPEWEWSTFTTDAYQDFLRDWEGCAIKARLIKRNPEFQHGIEKRGIIFEFHTRDLEYFPVSRDDQKLILQQIISNGVSNQATLIAPGARYPIYSRDYLDFFIGEIL